ncbi:MAG: Flp pilus assembly complex ATPase component TadA [Candidatus Marinimicrobia bacterium]|nr:Flp pilus assembly complex ATPase component TadA [Candidatus Neomarinimicrobiota bacterium]MCF7830173.1 Flp pilus assembly complex ATPase component TadA [Candidatus Neomarinimicrobiota bacterium]MCF7882093.1 Flp pilus assembly complex ATPase component TadA [Candidatus Neomarinimicrobiota bacterium]
MAKTKKKRLGEILIDKGLITEEQLEQGLERQAETGEALGTALVELGYVSDYEWLEATSEQLDIPYLTLSNYIVSADVAHLISEKLARKYKAIPLFQIEDSLTVGIADPSNVVAIDDLSRQTGLEIEPVLCAEREIQETLDEVYGGSESMDEQMKEYHEGSEDEGPEGEGEVEAPIINIVNLIFNRAIKMGASDIHLNPEENSLRIRYRIDGILEDIWTQPKHLQGSIISRIKIMADMDIAERRRPQDGRFKLSIDNKTIDFRVSTLPTVFGENVVLRILDPTSVKVTLSDLGLSESLEKTLRQIIANPYGIVLVTGPTGSGKTTTLYASLNELNEVEKNIITIEDPVEYQLPLIRQANMNPKAGMTFASGLRSILRQDPDIVMVGEIRDGETATVAVQAALTGHLVLSTLHTNDTAGALTRLVDMGVEPFLVSSSTSGIIAQRLVRKLCDHCKKSYTPAKDELKSLGLDKVDREFQFHKPVGCKKCRDSGYLGRIGIFEIMELTDQIRDLILKDASSDVIKKAAIKNGMTTLRHDGLRKVVNGITSVEELLRVTRA